MSDSTSQVRRNFGTYYLPVPSIFFQISRERLFYTKLSCPHQYFLYSGSTVDGSCSRMCTAWLLAITLLGIESAAAEVHDMNTLVKFKFKKICEMTIWNLCRMYLIFNFSLFGQSDQKQKNQLSCLFTFFSTPQNQFLLRIFFFIDK